MDKKTLEQYLVAIHNEVAVDDLIKVFIPTEYGVLEGFINGSFAEMDEPLSRVGFIDPDTGQFHYSDLWVCKEPEPFITVFEDAFVVVRYRGFVLAGCQRIPVAPVFLEDDLEEVVYDDEDDDGDDDYDEGDDEDV